MDRPLTVSLISTGFGPMPTALTLSAPAPASARAGRPPAWPRAVAAAATPEPLRNWRRDSPGPFVVRFLGSFIAEDPPLVDVSTLARPGSRAPPAGGGGT